MKTILFALIALNLTACATPDLLKSDATLREEHFARLATRSPEQVKADEKMASCANQANAYLTPQAQKAALNVCMGSN